MALKNRNVNSINCKYIFKIFLLFLFLIIGSRGIKARAQEIFFTCELEGLEWKIPVAKGILVLKPGDRPRIGIDGGQGPWTWRLGSEAVQPGNSWDFSFSAPVDKQYTIKATGADGGSYTLTVLTMVRVRDIPSNGVVDGFRLGRYPKPTDKETQVPQWFIRLPENLSNFYLSPHFRVGQFVPKKPAGVWPKLLLVKYSLVHKLEKVLETLNDQYGFRCRSFDFISAFRSPFENGSRAQYSRHIYGDAVDFEVDCDGADGFDDINGNGKHDIEDVLIVARLIQQLENHGEVVQGGTGVYFRTRMSANYPTFIHTDSRGSYQTSWGYVYNYGKQVKTVDW